MCTHQRWKVCRIVRTDQAYRSRRIVIESSVDHDDPVIILSHKSGKLTYRLIHDITEEILSRGEEGIKRDELKQLFPTLGRKEWKYTLNFLSSQGYTVDSSQDKIILNNQ